MHTVELLPDEGLASRVREMWGLLRANGFASLASHPHATNRPHLTVVTAGSLAGLPPLPVPIDATVGPPRMLGRALVLPVVPNAALRELHALVWSSLAGAWPPPEHWVPHLSLALRMPEQQRAAAVELISGAPPAGSFVAARSYDTSSRTVRDL